MISDPTVLLHDPAQCLGTGLSRRFSANVETEKERSIPMNEGVMNGDAYNDWHQFVPRTNRISQLGFLLGGGRTGDGDGRGVIELCKSWNKPESEYLAISKE